MHIELLKFSMPKSWRIVQNDVYMNEIEVLKRIIVDKSRSIYCLSPYLALDDLVRIKGKIDKAIFVDFETHRPAVLPKNHYVIIRLTPISDSM